jgi:hypothetical protein
MLSQADCSGDVCISVKATLAILGWENDFEFEALDKALELPDETPVCDLCSFFNKSKNQFYPTDHFSHECLRCANCETWTKTPDKFNHHKCEGKQLCKFFAGGFCKRGNACDFVHEISTPREKKTKRNIFERDKCVFFESGICRKGDVCAFKHGSQPCAKCGGASHDERHCAQCFHCHEWGHLACNCHYMFSREKEKTNK